MKTLARVLTLSLVAVAGHAAHAAEPTLNGLYIDVGPAGILLDTNASINVAGSPLPHSNAHASNNVTPGLGVGYFIRPDISVSAWIGAPPTTTLTGQGSLSGLTLGKITYGPSILVANYHFRQFGAFQPFLGAGISYTIVFGTHDDAIINLRVNNAVGAAIRAGFDIMLSDRWGVSFSANKVFLGTNLSGNVNPAIPELGSAPVSAHVTVNPLVLFSGVTFRF